MRAVVLTLLLAAACKDKAPTIAGYADELCACKDDACRDAVMTKIYKLMGEMTEQQYSEHASDMKRIDECAKSIAKDRR